jgi:carboxylate-amine ligase
MQSIVEVATHVAETVPEAIEEAGGLRAQLRDAAAESGALIASAGTHPFSRYEHQDITDRPRYRELIESMQWVAERELIFGLHVHVGLQSGQQAIAVANGLRTWLPELLALSVNSPFWQGRDTGLASTRVKLFDAFPRSGLPPAFASFEEFEALVERGVRTGSFEDYTYIWWDLRPHPKLGTIEIRICDGQTRLENVAGLVALIQSLAATLAERYERDGARPSEPRTLVEENKWRAARYGLEAQLIDFDRDETRPAREAALELVELALPAAQRLGCEAELNEIEHLCARGSGTEEQRRVEEDGGGLLAVARWLAEQTVAGV